MVGAPVTDELISLFHAKATGPYIDVMFGITLLSAWGTQGQPCIPVACGEQTLCM